MIIACYLLIDVKHSLLQRPNSSCNAQIHPAYCNDQIRPAYCNDQIRSPYCNDQFRPATFKFVPPTITNKFILPTSMTKYVFSTATTKYVHRTATTNFVLQRPNSTLIVKIEQGICGDALFEFNKNVDLYSFEIYIAGYRSTFLLNSNVQIRPAYCKEQIHPAYFYD